MRIAILGILLKTHECKRQQLNPHDINVLNPYTMQGRQMQVLSQRFNIFNPANVVDSFVCATEDHHCLNPRREIFKDKKEDEFLPPPLTFNS
jgi:hypothetical protein